VAVTVLTLFHVSSVLVLLQLNVVENMEEDARCEHMTFSQHGGLCVQPTLVQPTLHFALIISWASGLCVDIHANPITLPQFARTVGNRTYAQMVCIHCSCRFSQNFFVVNKDFRQVAQAAARVQSWHCCYVCDDFWRWDG
jgi:hypothetical protein